MSTGTAAMPECGTAGIPLEGGAVCLAGFIMAKRVSKGEVVSGSSVTIQLRFDALRYCVFANKLVLIQVV